MKTKLTAPTDVQTHDYNQELYLAHRRSDIQYLTGPRYAQQLADRTPSGKIGVAKYKAEQARVKAVNNPAWHGVKS